MTSLEEKSDLTEDEALEVPASAKIRDRNDYAIKDEREAEEDFLAPARWWFITTFFPLVAGTFGPVATALSICAIVEPWRVVVASSTTEQEGTKIADPAWASAVNGVSLGIAVLTNALMLLQMAEKVPFHLTTPLVISGWFISSFLLIGLVASASSRLALAPGTVLAQGFYYACIAAAIYFVIGAMLIATALAVLKFKYAHKFKLTTAQRTLMLQVMVFLTYVLAAAAVYSYIEGWLYLDAVYFTIVTLFTIGFGDYDPTTHLGRGLLFPMAIGGILFVGLIIGSIRTLVLQGGSTKVTRRMLERCRQRALGSLDHEHETIRVGLFRKHDTANKQGSELEIRRKEFELMREVQVRAKRMNQMVALLVSGGAWLALWLIGAVAFWQAEKGTGNWSYFEALYFAYVAFLTIGYGDFEPNSQATKPAFVFWALLALPTLTVLIGAIGDNLALFINTAALNLAEWTYLEGTTLQRGMIKSKKGKGTKHGPTKPPGFMEEGHGGIDPSKVEDKTHAAAAHALAKDFHHPHDADESHPDHREIQKHRATARRYRAYMLFKAVQDVVTHLDASPPRKYSFEEWCWFLKLLGEDETDPKNHRRLHALKYEQHNHGVGSGIGEAGGKEPVPGDDGEVLQNTGNGPVPWSWLGPRSPLMSSTDEPKWLLERLMNSLESELYNKEKELERRERGEKKSPTRDTLISDLEKPDPSSNKNPMER